MGVNITTTIELPKSWKNEKKKKKKRRGGKNLSKLPLKSDEVQESGPEDSIVQSCDQELCALDAEWDECSRCHLGNELWLDEENDDSEGGCDFSRIKFVYQYWSHSSPTATFTVQGLPGKL